MRCSNESSTAANAFGSAAIDTVTGLKRVRGKSAMVDTGGAHPISLDTVVTPSEIRLLMKLLSSR